MHDINFHEMLPQGKFELITDTTSIVALASPWWLPWLKELSELAALWLPILGAIWIVVQIGFKFYLHFWENRK
jgi:hypothetical protein